MSDRKKVYTELVETLKEIMEMGHQAHLVTLAMMMIGIVLRRNAQLSMMSSEVLVALNNLCIRPLAKVNHLALWTSRL